LGSFAQDLLQAALVLKRRTHLTPGHFMTEQTSSPDPTDLQGLSALIGIVYDSALEATQWKGLLAALNERFPGFMGAVYTQEGERFIGMYNPDGFNRFSQSVYDQYTIEGRVHGISDDQNDHRRELLNRIDPKIGDVYYSREIFTDAEFRSSVSYKTVLEPAGIGHWVSLKFAESGPREAVFIFFENEKAAERPDPEGLKLAFELISPHVVRATRIARALTMAREASQSFQGFLDAIALPMLVVDRDARLVFSNVAGRRLLDRGSVFRLAGNGQLNMAQAASTRLIRDSVAGVENGQVPSGVRVEDEGGPISLCIAPFLPSMADATEADRDLFEARRLFAIFAGTQDDLPVNPGLLVDTFDLTRREAEVCALLMRGLSPADIAQETGRAEKTIRNQIQLAYAKVGVNSVQGLNEALSVFKVVGAMFNISDQHMFAMQRTVPH
jgi:DNA-binding CsgD family transcriptional regulator